jgi:hypothetical protein
MRSLFGLSMIATLAVAACGGQSQSPPSAPAPKLTAADLAPPPALQVTPSAPVEWWMPLGWWRERYPQAAVVLDQWRTKYPAAAARLAEWDQAHPDSLRVLVSWAVTNTYEELGSFLVSRPHWGDLSAIAHEYPEALGAFVHWTRISGRAAEELATHRGALAEQMGQ